MLWLWQWGATAGAERRVLHESDERKTRLHEKAVARRRKAKRGGKR